VSEEYVIDANVLFGAFISGKDVYRLLFSGHTIYLPDFAFIEIEKYKQRILKKTKLDERLFQEFVLKLLRDVTVIPGLVISQASFEEGYRLCKGIDEKDTVYVAASFQLEATLITSDKALHSGLQERGYSRVALLGDVMARALRHD
jgi:predicted nucleic acid-binding protein